MKFTSSLHRNMIKKRWRQNLRVRRFLFQAIDRLSSSGIPESDISPLAVQLVLHAIKEFELDDRILTSEEMTWFRDRVFALIQPHIDQFYETVQTNGIDFGTPK